MVASSFGKLVMKERPREGVRQEDLALALLMMITNNIGQIAHLIAQLHHCNKIFFVGSFLRHNPVSCRRLAFAIDFWSGGSMEALFLAHEGYFGALGTFLQSAYGDDVDKVLDQGATSTTQGPPALSIDRKVLPTDGGADDDALSPKGWGRNIRKIAKWSASHFQSSTSSEDNFYSTSSPSGRAGAGRRVRSSSDDYYLKMKNAQTPK